MANYSYRCLRVVQQPNSPPFFLTAVPAKELLEWCDVPRAKGEYMAGYQRSLEPGRTTSLARYIELSPNNVIPGAVIVAVDADYVEKLDEGGVSEIAIREDTRDFDTKLEELFGAFSMRLSGEELESASINFTAADFESSDDESEYPKSYLAQLASELKVALMDWSSLSQDRREAIKEYIEGVSKPGLIIDGQHRVFGAAAAAKQEVILPVVLLPGLAYAEQVFQFYVLNSKAKPLKPTELRRIVSTTLTNEEIDTLYDRFRQAGIAAEEARWTLEMNTRPESPFRDRIDFGYGQPGAIIKENVADQLVRAFMKMPKKRYQQLTKPLGDTWTDIEARLEIFFWFWNAIKDEYDETWAAAEAKADEGVQHNLFLKVSLLTLQRFILDRFLTALPYRGDGVPPLSSEVEVSSMVSSTLANLPGEFFEREWRLKQIDTAEGKKELYSAMEDVWNNQGKIHGSMRLFKGQ